jgi:hypothetical protein
VRHQAPLRETLALSRASATSRSQTLALLGLFQTTTRANHPVHLPYAHDDVLGHLEPTFHCKWVNPLRSSSAKVPLMELPLHLRCKGPDPSLSCLCPLMGSQHPSGRFFSPMEARTGHLPMCTGPNGTCPSGMVLHIKSYALHGLIMLILW